MKLPSLPKSAAHYSTIVPRLLLGVLLVNLFVAALALFLIQQSHRQYEDRAELATRNLALVLANNLSGSIHAHDTTLLNLIDDYQHRRAQSRIDAQGMNAYIEQLRARQQGIDALRVTDAQGILRYGTGVKPGSAVDLSDRPHFISLRDNPQAGLVFSKPQISRINGEQVIVMARRIDKPGGGFDGMAFLAISLKDFSHLFAAVDVGPHGAISLRSGDLAMIARYPQAPGGRSQPGSRIVSKALEESLRQNPDHGVYRAEVRMDRTERINAYERVSPYPFYVLVGVSSEDYFAGWRREILATLAFAAFFLLTTLAAAWLIFRGWRRQQDSIDALSLQEAKFRTVADHTFDWEYWQGPKGEIIYMTPSCERITGYTAEEFTASPGLLRRIVHPDDQHIMEQHLHEMAEQDRVLIDFRIIRRDGEVRWIEHHCRAIDDAEGRSRGRRVSNRDHTERRRVEDALRESQVKLHAILDNVPLGVWLVGTDGRYHFVNKTFCDAVGVPESAFLATDADHLPQLLGEEIAASCLKSDRECLAQDTPHHSVEIIPFVDGKPHLLEITKVKLKDTHGKTIGAIGIGIDSTDRRQAEEELAEYRGRLEDMVASRTHELLEALRSIEKAEHRQRTMLEQLPVGVLLSTGAQQQMLYQNPRFVAMFGYSIDEFPYVAQWWPLAYPDEEYRAQVEVEWNRRLSEAIATQSAIEPMEVHAATKEGRVKFISIHATVIGELNFVTFIDLSERKRAEDAIQASMEKERLLIQQSRLASMGEMVHNIAHQWRQPLSALALVHANIKDDFEFGELSRESMERYAKQAAQLVRKMSSTIDDFRDFFKPNRVKEEFSLRKAVERALNIVAASFKSQGIAIAVEPGEDLLVLGFPNEFSQVLLNLLNNAKEAILNRHPSGTIHIAIGEDAESRWVRVRDSGGGFPEDIAAKLFDPYFTTKEKGTGIGLYMSRMIMEHMDGEIAARNVEGGAEFSLVMPKEKDEG